MIMPCASRSIRFRGVANNIEMSRRGYLLTLDDNYLDLYRRSILTVDQTLADLVVLTKQNPQQDARVKRSSCAGGASAGKK